MVFTCDNCGGLLDDEGECYRCNIAEFTTPSTHKSPPPAEQEDYNED